MTSKVNLEALKKQITHLKKQLSEADTTFSANKLELQIFNVERKKMIVEGNIKSKLDSINPRTIQGASPGTSKRT